MQNNLDNKQRSHFMRLFNFIIIITVIYSTMVLSQDKPYKEYKGVRFEGQQAIPYGAPDIELISFMGYRENFEEDKSYNLKVGFYFPYTERDSLYIVARELEKTKKFYFMRPVKKTWLQDQWQQFSQWPTKDVIEPLKIRVNRVGLVGRLNRENEGSGKIVPLHLFYSDLPDSIISYTLHFKPKEDLRSLIFKIIDLENNETIESGEIMRLSGLESHAIRFDFSKKHPGLYRIVLDGKLKYDPTMGPYREYTFYHNPIVK